MTATTSELVARADDRRRTGWDGAARGNASWFTLFSSDITPTAGMCAGIMEIPPNGGVLEPHWHQQAELYFVAEGTGILTVDGRETTISRGAAAFIPGDAEHSLRNASETVLTIFYAFPTDSFADVIYRFPGDDA